MKKLLVVGAIAVLLASLFAGIVPSSIALPDDWIIDGDKVYIEESWGKLEAYPHTISSSGWIYFNATPYQDFGELVFYWGFNTTEVKPTKAEFYKPHYVNWTTQHSQFFYNVSSLTITAEVCDYGNDYNPIHRNATYQICSQHNGTTGECEAYNTTTSIGCFDSYEQNGTNYTIYWHTNHSRIDDWIQQNSFQLEHTYHNYDGMTEWWHIKNFTVEKDKTYQTRTYVKVPVTLEGTSGKYYFAVKRNSETLTEAIAAGHFMVLDPWWNASWSHRKQWTVTNVNDTTLTDYPAYINVTDEPEMQADWDDVVFTDSDGNLIAYELENYTTGFGDYWANISSLPGSGTYTGWTYFGNDGATSQENPEGVWDSETKMVQHLQEAPANDTAGHLDSTSNDNDGTPKNFDGTATSTTDATGKIDGADVFDGTDDYVDVGTVTLADNTPWTISMWVKPDVVDDYRGLYGNTFSEGAYTRTTFGVNKFYVFNDDCVSTSWTAPLTADIWNHIIVVCDGYATASFRLYLNTVDKGLGGSTLQNSSQTIKMIGSGGETSGDYMFDGTIDEVRIYNRALSADEINQSYQLISNQSTYVAWGSPEESDTTFIVSLPVGYTLPHFDLTGIAGGRAHDTSGNANDGTIYGATQTDGNYGVGMKFDGDNDYIDCGNDASLDITDAITIAVWMNPNSLSNSPYLLNSGSYFIWLADTNDVQSGLKLENVGSKYLTTDTAPLTLNQWYYIVVTYDKDGGVNNWNVYVDGELLKFDSSWSDAIDSGQFSLLSITQTGATHCFDGTIDEVRIYNRALNLSEIQDNYNNSVTRNGLVCEWSFDHGPSTQTNVTPAGQNSTTPFYNVTNSGNVNLDMRMQLNTTVSTITLKADADNTPTGADTIGTDLVTIYPNLGQGSSVGVWLWSDFDHTPPQTANKTLSINVSQT